jgi:hypothetical protein
LKIRCDEHVSPRLVAIVRDLALSPGWEISSVLEVGHGGDSDVHWITKFAQEGGDGIVTADRDFVTLEPQVNAVFDTGMRVILMPKPWGMAKGYLQAAHMLQWWARIERKLSEMRPRECWRPDWNVSETGEIKTVKLDFSRAQRTRRKKARKDRQ